MGSILRLDLTYHKVIFFKSPLKVSDYKSLYQYEGLYITFYKPHPLFFFFKKKVKTVTHRVIVEWENYLTLIFFPFSLTQRELGDQECWIGEGSPGHLY